MFKNYLKLIIAIFIWGGVYYTVSFMLHFIDPISLAFYRYFLASIILLVILYKKQGRLVNYNRSNWIILFWTGVVGIGAYNIAFLEGEKLTDPNIVALIYSITPSLTAILSSIIFRSHIKFLGYLGMILSIAGAILIILIPHNFDLNSLFCHCSKGELWVLAQCCFGMSYNILNKFANRQRLDSLTITTYAAVFGTLLLFFAMIFYGEKVDFMALLFNWKFMLAFIYTSLAGSIIAYFWYSEAILNIGLGKTSIFLNALPFSAILIGFIFFGSSIKISILLAGLLIFIGVFLTNKGIIEKLTLKTRK